MQRITHQGVIVAISGGAITVLIASEAACKNCHAKSYCAPSSDQKQKHIVVEAGKEASHYAVGEEVVVFITKKAGMMAVTLSYLIPVALLVLVLVLFRVMKTPDSISALISLLILVIYFVILYTFGQKLSNKIDIQLEKK